MKLSQFDFNLPKERIALYPADARDEARLMVLNRKEGTIEHKIFKNVLNYFDDGDVMILNNTKVFPPPVRNQRENRCQNRSFPAPGTEP